MNSIILAGGKSSRLDQDKSCLLVGGRSLLQRVIDAVNPISQDIVLVKAERQAIPCVARSPRLQIVSDIYPDKGALGGLYTGLAASKSCHNLVVAADMPFLNKSLLRYMMHLAEDSDAVVPREGNNFEPLHAVYSQRCLAPIEQMLRCNNLKIQEIFPLMKVRFVDNREMRRFDPQCLSIFNINTPSDLSRAREIAKQEIRAAEFISNPAQNQVCSSISSDGTA